MPIKRIQKFESWSYSRLTEHERCPFRAKSKHIDKIEEPSSEAKDAGNQADSDAEKYATGVLKECPKTLERFRVEFDALRKIKRILRPQFELALDKDWKPTSWFNKPGKAPPWVRIKMDLMYDKPEGTGKKAYLLRNVIDYKNGKIRKTDEDQLELYAIGGLSFDEPAVDVVRTSLWYLREGVIVPETGRVFTRDQLPALIKKWAKRVAPMLVDTAFIPKPGNYCGWCHLSASKGGPCPL
jgi:hypothetical protein